MEKNISAATSSHAPLRPFTVLTELSPKVTDKSAIFWKFFVYTITLPFNTI
jgi:hypothetical protein